MTLRTASARLSRSGLLFASRSAAFRRAGGARNVANAERYAKFWLEPVSVADVRGFRANEMTEIRQIVIENEQLLLEKWYEYFGGEN